MSIIDLLSTYTFDYKTRLGVNDDGGYVIADNIGNYDCYISAGVANEESFSRDFIEKFNMNKYNSYAFDGTIQNYPYQYTNKITFIPKNIGNVFDNETANLSSLINNYNNIFLKMDIEGAEYIWLEYMNEEKLNKLKQIVIEFHGINDDSWDVSYNRKFNCISKIKNTHYLIHAHGNNYGGKSINGVPNTIELTYLRRDYFNETPSLNKQHLPIFGLDFPNNIYETDYDLGFTPFTS